MLGSILAFQMSVREWVVACFGLKTADDPEERGHRVCEEVVELLQSCSIPKKDLLALIDRVYGRPVSTPAEELGGVMITLCALASARKLDLQALAEAELRRVWGKIPQIRAKHASKPRNSPLPGDYPKPNDPIVVIDEKGPAGFADLMTALCNACPEGMQIESSDNDNDSGEIYIDAPLLQTKFLVSIKETA